MLVKFPDSFLWKALQLHLLWYLDMGTGAMYMLTHVPYTRAECPDIL